MGRADQGDWSEDDLEAGDCDEEVAAFHGSVSWLRSPFLIERSARWILRASNIFSRSGKRRSAGDDDRDVVRPASPVRQTDKNLAGPLGIARFDHDAMDVLVFDVIDEAVAAQQDAVTGLHGQASDVRRHLFVDSEGHRDHVLPGMVLRFLRSELAAIDHLLNEGMVPRHLENLSFIDDVDAGVPRVRDMKAPTVGDGEAQGRAPPHVRGKPDFPPGGANDRIGHPGGHFFPIRVSRHPHRPPRRRPPLNAIVMYGPRPGLYTRATTSPSVSFSRLNPGIWR